MRRGHLPKFEFGLLILILPALHLVLGQRVEHPLELHEAGKVAGLSHGPLPHHDDVVCLLDGGQSVRDGDRGPALGH